VHFSPSADSVQHEQQAVEPVKFDQLIGADKMLHTVVLLELIVKGIPGPGVPRLRKETVEVKQLVNVPVFPCLNERLCGDLGKAGGIVGEAYDLIDVLGPAPFALRIVSRVVQAHMLNGVCVGLPWMIPHPEHGASKAIDNSSTKVADLHCCYYTDARFRGILRLV
jgi:hypothetical protein